MRFPVVSETRSRRISELLEPAREMAERRDVVEATVGEGSPVVALGGRAPGDLAVQAVVVVVAGEALEGCLGVLQRTEDLAVQNLAAQGRPERFDLAVGPGRVDLGADVADLELAQGVAQGGEDPR